MTEHRVYISLDEIEAAEAEAREEDDEFDDQVGDITELSQAAAENRRTSNAARAKAEPLSALETLRRRLSIGGGGGAGSGRPMSSKQSTSSLLESVLMRNSVSRSPSFFQGAPPSGGYFPHPLRAPSFSRLPIPWSSTGAPRDAREADMLCGLALALSSYGAPLYRVEHRISQAAEDLKIPISIFCLPSTIMVSVGDGSARHPCRVQYLSYSYAVNVSKLFDVDKLARRVCSVRCSQGTVEDLPTIRKRAGTSTERGRPSVISLGQVQQSSRILEAGELPEVSSPEALEEGTGGSIKPEDSLDECLVDLQRVLESPGDYHRAIRIFAGALQSAVIAVLLFKGSWADGVAAFVLGGFTSVALFTSELLGFEGAVELLAAMACAALARFVEPWGVWSVFSGTGYGLCHSVVSLAGVSQMLPGTAITLGMLELGSTNGVAGSVRMFQAFIRALKLGYGLTTGSRLAIHIIQVFGTWVEPDELCCPAAGAPLDLWRLPLFIPMNLCILINLRAYPWQWVHMSITSLTGYIVSLVASLWFNSDITAGMAAFVIAVVANLYARRNDDVAIGPILAGIVWLVPGGIGVRGAIAAVEKTGSGTAFGIDMITRAMSIAVGIYMGNVLAFPIIVDQRSRDALRDKTMTM
ncbi:hypothetical protein HKX48_002345 [Thoreauomyces humboldtii]|nr:hypothetical protein HKX48_002345 [Thoreauomyces humboldtii]